MRRRITCVVFLAFIYAICLTKNVVRAQENTCIKDNGSVTYETDPFYGFDIVQAAKTAPVNPVVVTQDEKHRGVDIAIEIISYPGTITYETYNEDCIGYDTMQSGMETCSPFYKEGQYYYLKGSCKSNTEQVYRHIEGESLQVWLKPTPLTEQWLGWTYVIPGQYPLRFMFPEKWSLGTWTPEGFTTEGDPELWTEAQIDDFIAKHPGFNFLKADPRVLDLPSQFLQLAEDPYPTDGGSGRVIPLFGEFTEWNGHGIVSGPNRCPIEGLGPGGPSVQGHCAKTINGKDEGMFGAQDLFADDITSLIVTISNIPLDLPGEWYIGVGVSVSWAQYDGGKYEKVPDLKYTRRDPEGGYTLKKHSFLSYIWLTTPCNAGEVGGCDN